MTSFVLMSTVYRLGMVFGDQVMTWTCLALIHLVTLLGGYDTCNRIHVLMRNDKVLTNYKLSSGKSLSKYVLSPITLGKKIVICLHHYELRYIDNYQLNLLKNKTKQQQLLLLLLGYVGSTDYCISPTSMHMFCVWSR